MRYRDRDGKRLRESTNTEDWQEAQRKLRERLQARDDKLLAIVRKGEQLQFSEWADFFLENYSKPPIRAEKTHEANERAVQHLKTSIRQLASSRTISRRRHRDVSSAAAPGSGFGSRPAAGVVERGLLKPTTVHQEFRVLRRMLNVAVRKKLLPANPCAGVEFPVAVKGLFRPHYVTWSEQQQIEFHAPEYLRNVIRIITETGLRVYKELMPMKKDQVDLENAVVWIPDSKTPNGIAEVPLTDIAVEAFRDQIGIAGPGPWLFPSDENPSGHQKTSQDGLARDACGGRRCRTSGSTISARRTRPG